jgi:REP element-mobilizing transposase RayT
MSEKFQNKYIIKSARLENYDYAQNGLYFVTICTRDKEYFFGEIKNGEMVLNAIGKIANQFWQEIPKHFPFVNLDQFVIMPNHVHGILEINRNINESVETQHRCVLEAPCVSETNNVSEANSISQIADNTQIIDSSAQINKLEIGGRTKTQPTDLKTQRCCVSTVGDNGKTSNTFYKLKPGSLSVIVRSYKSIVTRIVNKQFPIGFHWQSKFYDHIIRNDESLNKIREYIIKNPEMWERDRNLPENLWM